MLFTVLAFAVALGLLITCHELGHYWVARRCGVRVERFSIGFGKVLWHRTDRHGTQWALSAIPLGGYVKMMNEAPPDANAAEQRAAFNHKPLIQRSAIVLAGPVANLILAVLLYAALGIVGNSEPAAILAQPPVGTAAAWAGVQAGDRALAVDDVPVQSWSELRWQLLDALSRGGEIRLRVETTAGRQQDHVLSLASVRIDPDAADPLRQAGLALHMPAPHIRHVEPDQAAAAAGLRAGDVIVQIDDAAHPSASQFVQHIQRNTDTPVALTVHRGGTDIAVTVIPRAQDAQSPGRIGVTLSTDFPMVDVRYGVLDSLQRGAVRTVETVVFSLRMMGRMLTGDVSVKNISGPVTIADVAGQTARVGLAAYLSFLALISVSIGVLNLLPIPMLDGGHLLYYVFEAIRGKPLPDRWQENGQRIGAGLLAALMALAFSNDLGRLFG